MTCMESASLKNTENNTKTKSARKDVQLKKQHNKK